MRTQKAKGIFALHQHATELGFGGDVKLLPFDIIQERSDFGSVNWQKYGEMFARPCPFVENGTMARHGFIDSRPVKNSEEAKALFESVLAVDPMAELVLMPFVRAAFSAVWTPGKLAVGPDNNGATAGHDSVSIRTTKQIPVNEAIVKESGIRAEDVPYLEFVRQEKDSWYAVQLRGGPDISGLGDDYLPGETEVKRVVLATGDLLEWEEIAKDLEPGTVVWHPGGTLGSHYAVHCKMNSRPIFTAREPKVGEILTVCACDPKPKSKTDWCGACGGYAALVPELDVDEALKGLSLGVSFKCNYSDAVKLVLGACHNSMFFGTKESRVLGCAVMLCLKLAFAASYGEAQYKKAIYGTETKKYSAESQAIYDAVWDDTGAAVKKFNEARKAFREKWSGGYGGKAWAICADATAELWNMVVRFVRSKTLDDLKQVVVCLNKVVDCAHNNGWWFNKFISERWFQIGADHPATPFITTAHLVYGILKETVEVGGLVAEIEAEIEKAVKVGGVVDLTPKSYGQLTIEYKAGFQEWNSHKHNLTVHFPDGSVKHFAGFQGVAKNYLQKMGDPNPSKAAVRKVYKDIAAVLGKPNQNELLSEWLIPDLSKADFLKTVLRAQGVLRGGSTLHIQLVVKDNGKGHSTKDVEMTMLQVADFMKWWPSAKKLTSLASAHTTYVELDVRPDGIYAGDIQAMALKNGKTQEVL